MASLSPFVGVMKFEVEPLSFNDPDRLLRGGVMWLQDAGGFAMFGLVLWVATGLLSPVYEIGPDGKKRNRLVGPFQLVVLAIAACLYLVSGGLAYLLSNEPPTAERILLLGLVTTKLGRWFELMLAAAGLAAIVGIAGPFVVDATRLRWRRIYALAKLSYQEAVRRRIVWVFLFILLIWLFPSTWFFREKPEDELKTIVGVTTRGMNVLLIAVGLLLAAFSIPADIKNLTIHTIVTKPVERFEVVLGRFFGYLGLITVALFIMTAVGLLFINLGNVSSEARDESMKARVARYGDLRFGRYVAAQRQMVYPEDFIGVDVGREDAYRRYIAGHPESSQRAVWSFADVPRHVGKDSVPLEFAFDVYRTTKGAEGTGVQVTVEVLTHQWDPKNEDAYIKEAQGLQNLEPGDRNWDKVNALAEKYGRYVWNSKQIFDYHTVAIPVPEGLFKNAAAGTPSRESVIQVGSSKGDRRLQVRAKCETPSQFVGVAKYDLYFLESKGNFSLNYFKGSIGLWFRLVLAVAIAVALSTYLAGVLSFLVSMLLFIGGFFLEFIQEVVFGVNEGGGPMESLARLVTGTNATMELDATPTVKVLQWFDIVYRWGFRRVVNVIPDVDRYGMSEYVAQGFSIGPDFLLINFLTLAAYVLPWLVASYYFMRAREIAA